MINIGQPERVTQDRVVKLFSDELGYQYLGDWRDRDGNSNIEETSLTTYLESVGYSKDQITRALQTLRTEANNTNRSLADNNQEVYKLLRYGVLVKVDASENTDLIRLI